MNTDSLLEFNPKLADVSHHTRIAYAKFMTTKLKKEIRFEDTQVSVENEKITRDREFKAFNKFKVYAGILKKQKPSTSKIEETKDPAAPPVSLVPEESFNDFRTRTPIEEDPNEDIQTPDRPSTPENVLDEPVPQISSSPLPAAASPLPKSSPSTHVTSPTPKSSPSPSPVPSEGKSPKPDSPMVKARSMSIGSDQGSKSPEPTKTKSQELSKTEEDDESGDEEDEKPENAKKASQTSTHLNVPSPSNNRPVSPIISISTGDKGKSKITGKTLTGWI